MRLLLPLSVLALAALALGACAELTRVATVPTNFVSHQLCSATFVSGVEPERFYREAVEPTVKPLGPLIRHRIDAARGEVTASFLGLVKSRAVYRPPLGCLVVTGPLAQGPRITLDPPAPARLAPIAGAEIVTPSDPRLVAALDRAFAEPTQAPHRWTKAVVVVHDGRIVAERYAPGYGVSTPLTGWSMTKSVTNALLGVLVRQGRLDMTAPAQVAAWADPKDPRHTVTPENLLRMQSGLDIGDSETPGWRSAVDVAARMQYAKPDMAGFIERRPLQVPPGTRWTYSDGNTLILSQLIRDQTGGDARGVLRFAHRELFDKLGMAGPTLEFDAAGTPIGSSQLWAPARDWARFGLLYLNDGVVGGERILPAGWVDFSARLTPGSDGYGAGFWTNRADAAGHAVRPPMPPETFIARGVHGQVVAIIPSAKLVIVRLGDAYTPYGDVAALNRLVTDALAVFPSASPPARPPPRSRPATLFRQP